MQDRKHQEENLFHFAPTSSIQSDMDWTDVPESALTLRANTSQKWKETCSDARVNSLAKDQFFRDRDGEDHFAEFLSGRRFHES